MNKRKQKTDNFNLTNLLVSTSFFTLLFFLIGVFTLAIASFILLRTNNPVKYIDISSTICLYASSLISGFAYAKKQGRYNIKIGLLLGITISLLLFIISLFLKEKNSSNYILYYIFIPIFTTLGSILGIKRERKVRKRKHHRWRKISAFLRRFSHN